MGKLSALLGIALALLTACSDEESTNASSSSGGGKTSVTQTIGPDGGAIELDGAKVTFPPGALAADTSITIAATTETPPSGFTALSRIYSCAPTGLTFDPKVVMAMSFQADGKTPTMFWSSGTDPSFQDVGGTVDA